MIPQIQNKPKDMPKNWSSMTDKAKLKWLDEKIAEDDTQN